MSGIKRDDGKPPHELIDPDALDLLARVLGFGARKYAKYNWKKGMSWGRVYSAMQRHVTAWWGGEDKDAETGLSHLGHAFCCLMFLIVYEKRGIGTDDRWKPDAQVSAIPTE